MRLGVLAVLDFSHVLAQKLVVWKGGRPPRSSEIDAKIQTLNCAPPLLLVSDNGSSVKTAVRGSAQCVGEGWDFWRLRCMMRLFRSSR